MIFSLHNESKKMLHCNLPYRNNGQSKIQNRNSYNINILISFSYFFLMVLFIDTQYTRALCIRASEHAFIFMHIFNLKLNCSLSEKTQIYMSSVIQIESVIHKSRPTLTQQKWKLSTEYPMQYAHFSDYNNDTAIVISISAVDAAVLIAIYGTTF